LNGAGRHLHSGDRKGNVSMPEHQQMLVADEDATTFLTRMTSGRETNGSDLSGSQAQVAAGAF